MSLTKEQIQEKLKSIFVEQFGQDKFAWEKSQNQYDQWDSLTHMSLVSKVEETFKIQLDINEVVSLASPQDFLKAVLSKDH